MEFLVYLEKLYNGHCLVDGPSHSFDHDFLCGLILSRRES
jgi:hypothetical protein